MLFIKEEENNYLEIKVCQRTCIVKIIRYYYGCRDFLARGDSNE